MRLRWAVIIPRLRQIKKAHIILVRISLKVGYLEERKGKGRITLKRSLERRCNVIGWNWLRIKSMAGCSVELSRPANNEECWLKQFPDSQQASCK
jgi:hypothetical protein